MDINQRSRALISARKRRTKGLKKKLLEFTTLCDVEACMVFVGSGGEIETWPEDETRVHKTIQRYTRNRSEQKEKNIVDISSYKDNATTTTKMMMMLDHEDELDDGIPENPSFFNGIDNLSQESLRNLEKTVLCKMKKVKERIELLNSNTITMNHSNHGGAASASDHSVHGFRDFMGEDAATKLDIGSSSYSGDLFRHHYSPPPARPMPKLLQLFPSSRF